jgi:hypothetical protein
MRNNDVSQTMQTIYFEIICKAQNDLYKKKVRKLFCCENVNCIYEDKRKA